MTPLDLDSTYVREEVETTAQPLFDTPMVRFSGVANLSGFVHHLQASQPHAPCSVAEGVTETQFFRDERLFETLHTSVLPALIRLREPTQRLRIWSAAASTGQEAFSLAILLADLFPQLSEWDIRIVGTDISRRAIDYAQRGRFRHAEVHRGVAPRILEKFFAPCGGEWEVRPGIAAMCDFRYADLAGSLPSLPRFDLILLRNVLLYFSPGDRAVVLENMHRQIAPDGCLALGASEQAEDSTTLFRADVVDATYLYRPC